MNDKWDERFLKLAHEVATWSKDRSTKVGCVVVSPKRDVRVTGYNGFPRNICDTLPERHERPAKYKWTEHAERNAVFTAARLGVPLEGCTMYSTMFPCADCARAIIQAGVIRLIAPKPNFADEKWGEDFLFAADMFLEAHVEFYYA